MLCGCRFVIVVVALLLLFRCCSYVSVIVAVGVIVDYCRATAFVQAYEHTTLIYITAFQILIKSILWYKI